MKKYLVFSLSLAVLGLLFTNTSIALAATSGPSFAGAGTDMAGMGTLVWSNPNHIISDNGSNATATVSSGGTVSKTTHYLQGTNFGFVIPAESIINGIQVSINRSSSKNNGTNNVQDNEVRLIKGGVVVGNNNKKTGNWVTTTSTVVNYGTISDLWGDTWTPADINASNFGVALSTLTHRTSSNTVTASVDYMRITITYTAPHALTYTAAANGSIQGVVSQVVSYGSSGSEVVAVPDTNAYQVGGNWFQGRGYHFTGWSDGRTDNPRIDTNVITDHNVTANFAVNTIDITATAGGGGTISPNGKVTVEENSTPTYTITANSGYHVLDVVVDGVIGGGPDYDLGPVTTYTFPSRRIHHNHFIVATFEADK